MSPPPTSVAMQPGDHVAGAVPKAGSAIPQRWLRIVPVVFLMYTIDFVARTNISLAFDRRISSLPRDLGMDGRMIGLAAGAFSLGYVLLQVPGGHLAHRWSPKKFISLCLVAWTVCAMSCGFATSFGQLAAARFFLGLSEAGVFPAAVVLMAYWFPARERVRATAFFMVSQPLAVAAAAPITGWWLGSYGWRATLIMEGTLPVVLLPIWWRYISDRPRQAKWLPSAECAFIEQTVAREVAALELTKPAPAWRVLRRWDVLVLAAICFLMTCFMAGLMPFFTSSLRGREFTAFEYGILFAIPYLLAAPLMALISWHSDVKRERRGHLSLVVALSGVSLILSVVAQHHFWMSYALMCSAIACSFAYLGPFFTIPTETFPRVYLGLLIGTVNAIGNLGGFAGPYLIGRLTDLYHSVAVPFVVLGLGLLLASALALLLPRPKQS